MRNLMRDVNTASQASALPIAAIIGYVIGTVPINIAPHQVTAFVENQQLTEGPAGVIVMFEIGAYAIAMMSGGAISPRLFRIAGVTGALAAAGAQLGCVVAPDLVYLCIIKMIAGAGLGVASSVMVRILSEAGDPGKNFGVGNALIAILSGALMSGIPWIPSDSAAVRVFAPLCALAIFLAAIAGFSTRIGKASASISSNATAPIASGQSTSVIALTLCALLIYLPLGGIWTFSMMQGVGIGLSERAAGIALAFMVPGGATGGVVAAWASRRMNNQALLFISCALGLCTCLSVGLASGMITFTLSFIIYAMAYMFGLTALTAGATEIDQSGRLPSIIVGATLIANAIGSSAVGMLHEIGGAHMVMIAGAASSVAAAVPVFWLAYRRSSREATQ